ncbi:MAG: thioesterase [Bacteroidales bacterium]|nr:thioesterase [Bacteroidales bacterium]
MEAQNSFERQFTITSYDVDEYQVLALPTLLCFLQETALNHVNQLDIGWDFLGRFNFFWVLSKMQVKIERMPQWDETITIRTWARKHDLFTQPREFTISDNNGNIIVAATSIWIILDTSGKFQKLDQFAEKLLFNENDIAIDHLAPKVRKIDFAENDHPYTPVLRSDLDRNHHTNNTKYVQWLLDAPLYRDITNDKISEITINYVSQSRLGDEYKIETERLNDTDYISSIIAKEPERELCRLHLKTKTPSTNE